MTYIKHKVVMLPTDKKAIIHKFQDKCCIHDKPTEKYGVGEPQHLYILSDEKIKEGDWLIATNIVKECGYKAIAKADKEQLQCIKDGIPAMKIIATTDKSLEIKVPLLDKNDVFRRESLPQPSLQFIEKYVEEYNKVNVITDVMVEYEGYFKDEDTGEEVQAQLKINPDNTINIQLINEQKEKIKSLILKFAKDHPLLRGCQITSQEVDEWIKKLEY